MLVGTKTVIDGQTTIGSHVSLQTNVYVPTQTTIGDNVFVGPGAVLTNDEYPVRSDAALEGPTIRDGASVGANATLLPGVAVGENAFVAAGAVVTSDVPPNTLAVGSPAETQPLPAPLEAEPDRMSETTDPDLDDSVRIADPSIDTDVIDRIESALEEGALADGPEVRAFESEFGAYCRTDHAVATSNGTTALHAALEALTSRTVTR